MKECTIGYSIPKEKVIDYIPIKTKWFATVIPGNVETYIFENENDYYNDYKLQYLHTQGRNKGGIV